MNEEFYHVVKRGVEERVIFLDNDDHNRFLSSLLVFNDSFPAPWDMRAFWLQRELSSWKTYKPKNPVVEIHAYALMKNHFHLLLRQIAENGITDFMRKLGGYSYYFNKKYKRVGTLFQGRFKAKLIETDTQLINTFNYIHTNPVEIIEPGWKEWSVKNPKRAKDFLKKYKWSSYVDYLGDTNNTYSNLLTKEFFLGVLNGKNGCRAEVESWIDAKTPNDMDSLILE